MEIIEPKFMMGQVVATPGALAAFAEAGLVPLPYLMRHLQGDWGEVPDEDARANDRDLRDGGRLLSAYTLPTGVRVWILTEAVGPDGRRASTCVLLPSEY